MENTQITIKLTKQEKELLEMASNKIGLGHTTFARSAALEKAHQILKN